MLNTWILPFAGGALLGAVFFGGLLLTIVQGFKSARPELWFLISLIVRMSLAISGFILISAGHWDRLLACLVGFLLARVIVFTHMPSLVKLGLQHHKETKHASER
ncbi:MAG: hypothetical protein JWN70_2875 [Planctomycetaceae bacterium]|nr:hypothetical protein [Planctomycetaceae bacterium]